MRAPESFRWSIQKPEKIVLKGNLQASGQVDAWGETAFWIADFSSWRNTRAIHFSGLSSEGEKSSCPFAIEENVLELNTLSNIVYHITEDKCAALRITKLLRKSRRSTATKKTRTEEPRFEINKELRKAAAFCISSGLKALRC
jgi:hypothetical protein